jgi:hypothetical protein
MPIIRGIAAGAVLVSALASTALTTPNNARAFPAFTMFRGVGLEQPALMYHANVTTDTIKGLVVANLKNDPLALIYTTLVATSPVRPDDPRIVATFEVAEFFGPPWSALAGPDGRPTRVLQFEEANHFSKIHVMRDGPPIWMNPVVAPGGGSFSALRVSDTAIVVLSGLGLKLQ